MAPWNSAFGLNARTPRRRLMNKNKRKTTLIRRLNHNSTTSSTDAQQNRGPVAVTNGGVSVLRTVLNSARHSSSTMAEETFQVKYEAPKRLLGPMNRVQKTLMGAGPSNCSEQVLRSMGYQLLGHMHPETFEIMDDIKLGIQYVFQTNNRLTLALSASAHAAMEASIGNILERGETLLVVKSGFWGERVIDMATRIGIQVQVLNTELGHACDIDDLEDALKKYRPAAVFIVHSESSIGMRQPLDGIGDLVHKYDSLLIVDAVASVGVEPFFADDWGVDVVYTGSQKGISAPPGITPISFSPLAEKKLWARKTKVPVFYWDMTILGDYWACFGRKRVYHHTISATLLYGLREALAHIVDQGLPAVWSRHAFATEKLHQGLRNRGLEFFIKNPECRLKAITAIKVPAGINETRVIRKAMETYNVEIAGGLGPTLGSVFRIGLMGTNATSSHVDLVLRALDSGLLSSNM